MERTVENLKEMIRAGRGKIPAHKVIRGGQLVNVMSSEVYPADIAVYNDMIAAVGDVEDASQARWMSPILWAKMAAVAFSC